MEQQREILSKIGTPIEPPAMKPCWRIAAFAGIPFWIAAFALWYQKGIDEWLLFFFNPARMDYSPLVKLSELLSDYGIAAITIIYILYFLAALKFKQLDAPLTIYLFILTSLGISGIAGDLLKEILARPRPIVTYADQIIVFSQSTSPAIPSGHATKSVAMVLPFLIFVSSRSNWHKTIKLLLITLALGTSFSRIVLGAHYLSDVFGGFGTAFIGLPFAIAFSMMVLKQTTQEQLPRMSKVWGILLLVLVAIFSFI